MRVRVFTQYFPPEIGATQTRLHAFASGLARRQWDVDVICEVPNHPQGIVRPGYRGRAVRRQRLDGFGVSYVWVLTRPVKTTAARLGLYGSYAAMATMLGAWLPRPDVVFASSPPLPVAAAGAMVAKRHRVPWVLDVRDLWPAAAVAMGELGSGRALRLAELLERRLYESADAITATTQPFARFIGAITDPGKVTVLPNGTSPLWVDGASLRPDRTSLGLPSDRFLWTFAGNVGTAQGLESAVDAARHLGEGFQLLILGNGPARARLEQRAGPALGGRVIFRDQVAPAMALRYLRASDALLVSLAPDPTLADFVPSKLFDFSAVGRPVILAAAGEPRRLVEAPGAAFPIPPGDPGALMDAVRKLAVDPSLRERLSRSGHEFGRAHLREEQVERLDRLLRRVVVGAERRRL